MKDYDLEERRVGTTCTFTGGGSLDPKRRLMLSPIVWGFAAIFVLAISTGYYLAQTSSRTPPVPEGLTPPALPGPGVVAATSPDPQASFASQPAASGPSPAQSGSGEVSQGPAAASPTPPASARPSAAIRPQAALVGATHATLPAIPAPPSRFHVQVGSFDSREGAVSLLGRVRELGYAATLVEGPPYRVWVGGYLDLSTASLLAAHLQAAHFDTTLMPR